MTCVMNLLYVLSLTVFANVTFGARQFDLLDKKINAVKDMMELEIEMIKDMIQQDLAIAVMNLSMIWEVQGERRNVNTLPIANNMGEYLKHSIKSAEVFHKVIQRGFVTEKIALRKIVDDLKKDLVDIVGSIMSKSETLAQFQLILAEINKNKNDIESKVNKAKHDAIMKSNEDCMISNIKLSDELTSLKTYFMKIVNDVNKDVADIAGSVMNKSETLTQLQLINAEIIRNKNDIEAKVDKAKQDAILKSNEDCKNSVIQFSTFTPHKYGNSIYFKLDRTMEFSEGSRLCKQYGAHLPDVTTSGENAFLLNTFGERIFLGATDLLTEGQWVWENTGQAVGFQDWYPGEPNDIDGEDCLEIYRSSWNDITCTAKLSIVCEFDI